MAPSQKEQDKTKRRREKRFDREWYITAPALPLIDKPSLSLGGLYIPFLSPFNNQPPTSLQRPRQNKSVLVLFFSRTPLVPIKPPPQIPRPLHQFLILVFLHLQFPLPLDGNGLHLPHFMPRPFLPDPADPELAPLRRLDLAFPWLLRLLLLRRWLDIRVLCQRLRVHRVATEEAGEEGLVLSRRRGATGCGLSLIHI